MDFPKSYAVAVFLAVMAFAVALIVGVYFVGGLEHSVWLVP